MHLSIKQKKIVHKVRMAMDQVKNGEPLKDYIDDEEIINALDLLLLLENYNLYHKREPKK